MRIWSYNPDTLQLIATDEPRHADADPLNPEQHLIPAHATPIEPLPELEGNSRHFDKVSSVWFYRELPPEPEPVPPPTAEQIRRGEILGRLSAIDAASVRPSREIAVAVATGQPAPAFAAGKLADLENEAALLRAELATLPA